jgi:hypothetical protein
VPRRPEAVLDLGEPRFQVLDYSETVLHGVSFANGRSPDLVHAWTPREHVRKTTMSLTRRYNTLVPARQLQPLFSPWPSKNEKRPAPTMLNPGTDCRLACLRAGMHYSTLLKEMVRVPALARRV